MMADSPVGLLLAKLGSELGPMLFTPLLVSPIMQPLSSLVVKNFCLPCPCHALECFEMPSIISGHGRHGPTIMHFSSSDMVLLALESNPNTGEISFQWWFLKFF